MAPGAIHRSVARHDLAEDGKPLGDLPRDLFIRPGGQHQSAPTPMLRAKKLQKLFRDRPGAHLERRVFRQLAFEMGLPPEQPKRQTPALPEMIFNLGEGLFLQRIRDQQRAIQINTKRSCDSLGAFHFGVRRHYFLMLLGVT